MADNLTTSPVITSLPPAKQLDVPDYSEEERKYLQGLQIRLTIARDERESKHDEFDGMTYSQWWEANEKGGQTYIEPRTHKEDSNFQSGTSRRKIFSFLAELLKIDWHADVNAFDQNDLQNRALGDSVEDAIVKTNEMDNDDEKQQLRFYEMLKQGDVFVEKQWDESFIKEKTMKGSRTFDGKVSGVSWTTKLKRKWARPTTRIIPGINVYQGNMKQYDFGLQPYVFTVDVMDYGEAESIYREWERWDYVSKTMKQFFPDRERTMLYNNWRLLDLQKDKVERIRYQDKWGNEFALILNGVLMTPVGLPLPWGYDDYNIVQQHLKPLSAHFAYGASMVKEMKNNVTMYDDLVRLMHMIVKKNLEPARFNLTGRTLSRRVFMPSAITAGIDPKQVPLADDRAAQGLGAGEFNFVNMLANNIDKNSIGPIPSGEQPGANQTATEVLQISAAAKTMLGNILIAAQLLEWKLSWLSLFTILAKWFDPTGDRVDEARSEIVKKYRTYGVTRPIGNQGMGRRITVPTSGELPTPDQVKGLEDTVELQTGVPHRFIFLKPDEVTDAKWTWQITMRPKPKANDEMSKMMFNKMVSDAVALFGPDVNLPELEAEYAVMWDRDPRKLFTPNKPQPVAPAAPGTNPVAGGVKPPSPQDQMGRMMSSAVNP